jgi:phenylalanyl-tRNA synthetase beta subunit
VKPWSAPPGLLLEITGGEAGPIIETVSEQYLPSIAPVTLRAQRVEQMLGLVIEEAQIVRLLTGLAWASALMGRAMACRSAKPSL